MVALRLIDCNEPYWRTYTNVVKWFLFFDTELTSQPVAAPDGKTRQVPS